MKLVVTGGVCGFTSCVETLTQDMQHAGFRFESDCANVRRLAESLGARPSRCRVYGLCGLVMRRSLIVLVIVLSALAGAANAGPIARTDQKACLRCHGMANFSLLDPKEKTIRQLHINPAAYSLSVHSEFVCQDCHQDYTAYPHKPGWAKKRASCDQECHQPTTGRLTGRIRNHVGIGRKNRATKHFHEAGETHDHPGCVDCHGGDPHAITSAKKWTRDQREAVCLKCHDDHDRMDRFNVNETAADSYRTSFHGKAHALGLAKAPVCDDCHTAHDIRPAKDPTSTVNSANLRHTCGRCHKDTGRKFIVGSMHIGSTPGKDGIVKWTKTLYRLFVWAVILQFVALIIFDLGRRYLDSRKPRKEERMSVPERHLTYVERFSLGVRIQHMILIFSFFMLVLTGMPLVAPTSRVSTWIIGMLGGMAVRAILHRIAACMLLALGLYHVIWGIATKEGRTEIKALIPNVKDVGDALLLVGHYFGITEKPQYDRYSWIEKFEYFGVVWGSLIMAVTGFMLWFKAPATAVFPKWALDAATVVHGYEARLAFLTIIVWHFYNVVFSPDVFPMSMTWLTGKIAEHRMQHEHPLEYQRAVMQTED